MTPKYIDYFSQCPSSDLGQSVGQQRYSLINKLVAEKSTVAPDTEKHSPRKHRLLGIASELTRSSIVRIIVLEGNASPDAHFRSV
ncbi:MAG: hypothetical protein R2825_15445 [Saprospiraceae bacterium]